MGVEGLNTYISKKVHPNLSPYTPLALTKSHNSLNGYMNALEVSRVRGYRCGHGDLESAVCLDLCRERAGLSPECSLFCLSLCVRCGLRTHGVKS